VANIQNEIQEEKDRKVQEKERKRLEFMQANDELKMDKIKLDRVARDRKHLEAINYFPFTHGDVVEQH